MPMLHPSMPKHPHQPTIADLAEQSGRHYRSPHLRRARGRRAARVWAIAAVIVVLNCLALMWLLPS
jgi:type IV secretory pathway component VirB8